MFLCNCFLNTTLSLWGLVVHSKHEIELQYPTPSSILFLIKWLLKFNFISICSKNGSKILIFHPIWNIEVSWKRPKKIALMPTAAFPGRKQTLGSWVPGQWLQGSSCMILSPHGTTHSELCTWHIDHPITKQSGIYQRGMFRTGENFVMACFQSLDHE